MTKSSAIPALLVGCFCFAPFARGAERRIVPANGTRRIVILGSSTAYGDGSSDHSRSWAGLFTAAVGSLGFEVVNTSIGGSITATSISRFAHDVVPQRPDFVILATSLWNEGFAANPVAASNTFLQNTRTLIGMVEAIGAVPILFGPYPNSASTPQHVAIVKTLYAAFEATGLPLWDEWNGLADENGKWLPGLSADGTHPVDIGHRYMFEAIPLTYFPAAYSADPQGAGAVHGRWISPSGNGEVLVSLAQILGSWSLGARVYSAGGAAGSVIAAGGEAGVKLVRTADRFDLYIDGQLYRTTSVASAEPWIDILLSYRSAPAQLALYINGVAVTAASVGTLPSPAQALWRTGCARCAVTDLVLYRAGFGSDEAVRIHGGEIPKKSLEFWTTLTAPAGAPNDGGTATGAAMLGDWRFSRFIGTPPRASANHRHAVAELSR